MEQLVHTNEESPKIVTIGGGTGQHTLLKGLKDFPVTITALVSMADDGSSTGVLRDEMGVLPPGDVRNCISALSEESNLVRALFSYRFSDGPAAGHAFGNLFLSALEKISGSFPEAVEEASRLLLVKGSILPISLGDMRLRIELKNGTVIIGEKHLDDHPAIRATGVSRVLLTNSVAAYPPALRALERADLIVIGPGDMYGSIIPPLLVDGIVGTLKKSNAPIVYVANLTNKKGQTDNFDVPAYVNVLERVLGTGIITHVVGNSEEPAVHLKERYEEYNNKGSVVMMESGVHVVGGITYVGAPVISTDDFSTSGAHVSFIRHDAKKLSQVLLDLVARKRG